MIDTTGQQDTKIRSGLPEEPAPIAVYAATPFNANTPASSKQPITASAVEETDFKYFQRQVASLNSALWLHQVTMFSTHGRVTASMRWIALLDMEA